MRGISGIMKIWGYFEKLWKQSPFSKRFGGLEAWRFGSV